MPEKIINRTGIFIIGFQLGGLCTALRATVPHGLSPGAGTLAILKKLRDDFAAILWARRLAARQQISVESKRGGDP